jgi:hypothetical protein
MLGKSENSGKWQRDLDDRPVWQRIEYSVSGGSDFPENFNRFTGQVCVIVCSWQQFLDPTMPSSANFYGWA